MYPNAFVSVFGTAIINAQKLCLEYNGEKVKICQFQEKLVVGILQAHFPAASNKTISSRQHHELRENEERVQQNRRKHRHALFYHVHMTVHRNKFLCNKTRCRLN
jgi:hypothetical protein